MAKLTTPEAILSYPHLFKRQKGINPGDKEKFSAALVFTPEAQKTPEFEKMKAEAMQLGVAKWGEKFPELVRAGKVKWPFRKDDDGSKGYPAGSLYINVRSDSQPGIVGREPDPSDPTKPRKITNEQEIYAGCKVRATISGFTYDQPVNKGVSFGLNNIQKLADGDRIDGRAKAEDEFKADLSAAPMSIDDLT